MVSRQAKLAYLVTASQNWKGQRENKGKIFDSSHSVASYENSNKLPPADSISCYSFNLLDGWLNCSPLAPVRSWLTALFDGERALELIWRSSTLLEACHAYDRCRCSCYRV